MNRIQIFCLVVTLFVTGCATTSYNLAGDDEIPAGRVEWNIAESPFIAEVERTYGKGVEHERAKIKYLLGHTQLSDYEFDRNGHVYDGDTTAKHLRKKYRKVVLEIESAQQFIDYIAAKSSISGRPYYALPGDGRAYRTNAILSHELNRLEEFLLSRK